MMNACLLAVLITAAAPPFSAETLDGEDFRGPVIQLDSKHVTLETDDGPKSVEIGKLIRLVPEDPPKFSDEEGGAWIELVDGSVVVAGDYAVDDQRGRLIFSDEEAIELPVAMIAVVRLQDQSGATAAEWARIRQTKFDSDVLVTRKDEVLDYHRGVLRDVTDAAVQFEIDGEVLSVKRSKVHGLIYYRRLSNALPDSICVLGDTARSHWSVSSLTTPQKEKLRWTTPAGATVTRPLANVASIDFSQGKVVYLSDLNWESATFTPYFGTKKGMPLLDRFLAPRKDTNLHSEPLRIAGEDYKKGISIHSRTEIIYRLPGRFRWFRALAGIDDSVRPHGNVRLVIIGDDRMLLEATITGSPGDKPVRMKLGENPLEAKPANPPFETGLDAKFQPYFTSPLLLPEYPVKIDVPITGVRRLTLLVDFGEELDVSDHLDLCNARVVK